jgi:cysteine desulfurase
MLIYNLDIEGIACSGGSACSSGSNKGSHVLTALLSRAAGSQHPVLVQPVQHRAGVEECVGVLKRIFAPVLVAR